MPPRGLATRPSDEPHTPASPCPRYTDVDIFDPPGDRYLAGAALLAEIARHGVDRREEAGEIDKAEAEAFVKAASAAEDHFLNELSTPSQKLGEVAVKLAAAYRTAWWNNHGNGVYGAAALSLIGSALSDLILLREAEVERRRRVGERAS